MRALYIIDDRLQPEGVCISPFVFIRISRPARGAKYQRSIARSLSDNKGLQAEHLPLPLLRLVSRLTWSVDPVSPPGLGKLDMPEARVFRVKSVSLLAVCFL